MTQRPTLTTLALVAGAALALTGCGSGDSTGSAAPSYTELTGEDASIAAGADSYTPPPLTYSPHPTRAQSTAPSADQTDLAFELTLRKQGLIPGYGDTATSIGLAHSLCQALVRGADAGDVTDVLMNSGYTATAAGFFYGAATAAYCPGEG